VDLGVAASFRLRLEPIRFFSRISFLSVGLTFIIPEFVGFWVLGTKAHKTAQGSRRKAQGKGKCKRVRERGTALKPEAPKARFMKSVAADFIGWTI
jgi:hypothetical protein